MSVYRKQRARVLESMENGSGEIHKPDWLFYNVMSSFMDAVYNPRKSKSADKEGETYENPIADEIMIDYSNQEADDLEPTMYEQDEEIRNHKQFLRDITKPAVNLSCNTEDEYDLFCRSYALQLKKLPEITALRIMQKMQNMMIQKKIDLMADSEEATWLDIDTNTKDPLCNKRKASKSRRRDDNAKRMKLENDTFESE